MQTSINTRIKNIREEKGLSIEQVACNTHLTALSLSDIEENGTRLVSYKDIKDIANALDVNIAAIVDAGYTDKTLPKVESEELLKELSVFLSLRDDLDSSLGPYKEGIRATLKALGYKKEFIEKEILENIKVKENKSK